MAVGRRTVTEGLNLETTGVETKARGEILVDEYYRTAEPGVYATGDVIGGHWLAHVANHEGMIAAEHMTGKDPASLDPNLVPRVTFCRPEISSFGLTEDQARERGQEVRVGRFPFRAVGTAVIEGFGRTEVVTVEVAPDGALWIVTSNTDRATWGGTAPRPGDDRILRVEVNER